MRLKGNMFKRSKAENRIVSRARPNHWLAGLFGQHYLLTCFLNTYIFFLCFQVKYSRKNRVMCNILPVIHIFIIGSVKTTKKQVISFIV